MRTNKAFLRIGIDARLINQTGVGRYTQELIANLEKIDKENTYLIFLRQPEYQNLKFKNPNFEKRLAEVRWHSLKEQLILPWVLWREHLDIIHFPYFSVPIFYPGKFVVTIHDLILNHFDTGKASTLPWIIYKIKRMGYKLVLWMTLRRAIKVITVSETTELETVDHYKINPEKIVVIYEAAGADIVPPLRCEAKQYFLYVGNAYPHKNLERLCEAFLKLKTKNSKLKLILVGPDDYFYKKLKKKISQIGLIGQIVFYGPATREELNNLYKNAIALVFPSLMEGFGLPGIEAMANGCPVICSDLPVFREIYGKAAIYFNPLDINDIRNKLEQFCYHDLNHSIRNELVKKGFEQVKKYSWQKLAQKTLNIYLSFK